ncbi:NAD(P)/FAD-dependent oxidoreductase [Cupriavidus sp. WS]|uniref:NAD(P)-binding protein n=1 Tax=Cupriavidus sp. WS TaxID=1312922 RepID=UPI00037FAC1E|nr:NAD(P)/FAD-dependent oxidoreductase [Cupriavidus sp. WS]
MDRRRFLIAAAGTAGTGLLAGCDRLGDEARRFLAGVGLREPWPAVLRPGMAEGHALRDAASWPAPQDEIVTEVAILGGGVAGLSAAWQLARAGLRDFLLVEGPEFGGNAAAGRFGELGFPRGAHYLPLPSLESAHIREMLADTGVIARDPFGARPEFDERALVHAPDERLLFDGKWHDGLLPSEAVAGAEAAQHARFLARMAQLKDARGGDGRKAFAIPLALASQDPAWTALDRQSMRQWMAAEGFTSPTLHAYVDYCCRDDYGAGHDAISAWAGVYYFASRAGHAANAADGAVLTWPDGLHTLVARLAARIDARRAGGTPTGKTGTRPWRQPGMAVQVREHGREVRVLCAQWPGGTAAGAPRLFRIRARRVICAMPLHVAAHVAPLAAFGFDPARHLPPSAPWLVSSFRLRGFPDERPGVPLAWDNVVHGGRGLGYVVSTHQLIRQAMPADTVFTAYCPLDAAAAPDMAAGTAPRAPADTRRWLAAATPAELMDYATTDLRAAYGRAFWRHADAAEITVRGHAMASPRPGFLANAGAAALRDADGRILFAHADLSGLSVFEEAAWWGTRAARRITG